MISNPISVFVTGNRTREFVYEGGKQLWHFSPKANGLSNNMEFNVIFFANSESHALDVLSRVFNFIIGCEQEYIEDKRIRAKSVARAELFLTETSSFRIVKINEWLSELQNGNIQVELVSTNQLFKVGWASNDTV